MAGRRVRARRDRYMLALEPQERALIRQLLGELRELLALQPDDPRVRRLYPAAYAEEPELEDEYRQLTQEELRSGRLASVDAVEASVDAKSLTADELTSWMQAINALRLVLGTMLDITDDDEELAFSPSDPNARTMALYGYLGGLLDEIVTVQLDG
ncbi:MAG TPA: DUF2017 family protein [Solirubrobacter sp.]|nr:DUF2017 family protein [Solirubrobacter sp.]